MDDLDFSTKSTRECSLIVELSNTQAILSIEPDRLIETATQVLALEGLGAAQLSLVLVDDREIQAINRQYLQHDDATDIITFPISEPDEEPLVGELVISTETAVRVSHERGVDPWSELTLYVVHGILHLTGFDDHSPEDRLRMRAREQLILDQLGVEFDRSDHSPRTDASAGRERVSCLD